MYSMKLHPERETKSTIESAKYIGLKYMVKVIHLGLVTGVFEL